VKMKGSDEDKENELEELQTERPKTTNLVKT
jgi:hypothetical protein